MFHQILSIINCFLLDIPEAIDYLRQHNFLQDLIRILSENSENIKLEDICLRIIRNCVIQKVITINDLLSQVEFQYMIERCYRTIY